jgi:hypothetical protein
LCPAALLAQVLMPACCKLRAVNSLKHSVNIPLQTMQKFSTVKNACDSLSQITGKYYSFKYELLHGKRFYFVHVEQELPFNIRQFSLVCRGDKQTVISKLQIIAGNQPTF